MAIYYYIYGTGFRELKKGRQEIELFKGPIEDKAEAIKRGMAIWANDFEIFECGTKNYQLAKSIWKSQKLDKTGNISDSLQPLYNVKEN